MKGYGAFSSRNFKHIIPDLNKDFYESSFDIVEENAMVFRSHVDIKSKYAEKTEVRIFILSSSLENLSPTLFL